MRLGWQMIFPLSIVNLLVTAIVILMLN
jgi:NADH:ubiquinone oxidoreductase subunit H